MAEVRHFKPKQMTIRRFTLIETGTYVDQYVRPYEINVNKGILDAFVENTEGGFEIDSMVIARELSDVIRPQANVERKAEIDNGWGTRRLRFTLVVEYDAANGSDVMQDVVTGYSDSFDPSFSGEIDPDTVFHISNITSTKIATRMGLAGRQHYSAVLGSNSLLKNNNGCDYTEVMIRPEDIISTISTEDLMMDIDGNFDDTIDERTLITNTPSFSRRTNAIGSRYVGNILKAHKNAIHSVRQDETSMLDDEDTLHSPRISRLSRTYLREQQLSNDVFMRRLASITGYSDGTFVMDDLRDIDPGIDNHGVIEYNILGDKIKDITDYRDHTADFRASDLVTQAASIIGTTIPALLVGCGIDSISFSATNDLPGLMSDGDMEITINDARCIGGIKDIRLIDGFKSAVVNELLNGVTLRNEMLLYLHVRCEVTGDCYITIDLDHSGDYDFCMPVFADSNYSPVRTKEQRKVTDMTSGMSLLMEELETARERSSSLSGIVDRNGLPFAASSANNDTVGGLII